MVRFTDIINLEDGKEEKQGPAKEEAGEEKLWFTNTELISLKKDEEAPKSSGELARDSEEEIASCYDRLVERQREVAERVKGSKGVSPSPILADLHHVIEKGLINHLYDYAALVPAGQQDLETHAVAVTFGALKIGKGMEYDIRPLLKLSLAAFLGHVGMYRIPEEVWNREIELDGEDIELLRRHPEFSHEILSQLGRQYQWLAEIVLQIHERADGSGYPKGLSGGDILEEASIIGLMDTYVSLINDRGQRKRLIQPDAVKYIITRQRGLFPPKVLKVFLNQISLFPVGTMVRLNNKHVGRVVSTNEKQPLRPVIEILFHSQGNRLQGKESIRLSENPLLYITQGIDERDL
ncbi:MAG: hypothetical protein JRJ03_02655 [Deltaproteobacteria bacterium]|nr:hypothetical protein [Deltaproteobacteria bacterium]MBW2063814.1 hypothetical protein [Deltaproteobacteria bacterium]